MAENSITIYGTSWCGDCTRACRFFDLNNIKYKWVDIDIDAAGEDFVLINNNGMRSVPTICFNDGSIVVEPSNVELEHILEFVLSGS
jgi:glutaredoxin-like protein